MRSRAFLPLLALTVACSGDPATLGVNEYPDASASRSNPAHGGWSFNAVATYVSSPSPGEFRFTGNVMHWTGIVNQFALTGDLEGWWYFEGETRVVLGTGKGPARGSHVTFDLTSPGVGTFDCRANGILEDWFGAFRLSGKIFSCDGSGAFEGQRLKATYANRPGTAVYDIAGTIY